eukprot:364213-Chlamydomonas_euryale.AAC.12
MRAVPYCMRVASRWRCICGESVACTAPLEPVHVPGRLGSIRCPTILAGHGKGSVGATQAAAAARRGPRGAGCLTPPPSACRLCPPKDKLTAQDLLPKDAANSKWAQVVPAGQGDVDNQNYLTAGYLVGLTNSNLQLESLSITRNRDVTGTLSKPVVSNTNSVNIIYYEQSLQVQENFIVLQDEESEIFLNDLWSLYFHDPFDSNWTVTGYVKIGDIASVCGVPPPGINHRPARDGPRTRPAPGRVAAGLVRLASAHAVRGLPPAPRGRLRWPPMSFGTCNLSPLPLFSTPLTTLASAHPTP